MKSIQFSGMLIRGQEVEARNSVILRSKSDRILRFLSENREQIETLIRTLPGYIGPRGPKDPV